MINNIKEFIKLVTHENFNIELIHSIYSNKDEEILNIKDGLWITEDSQPTISANNETINFIMDLNQSYTYLNDHCSNIIKEFENSFNCYLNIYNQIQSYEKVKDPTIFVKITYDIKSKSYTLSTTFYKNIFYTYKNSIEPNNMFAKIMRSLIRSDPDVIMVGEMRLSSTLLVHTNTYNYKNVRIIPNNYNLIYSSNGVELNNIFTVVNGLYKEHELFTAIQSYLNLTESDSCNILDPNLIKDKVHLNDLLTLKKMIDI
jgi:hypothetical protein